MAKSRSEKRVPQFIAQAGEMKNAIASLAATYELVLVCEEDDIYGSRLIYQNQTTALVLDYSPSAGNGWRGMIARLEDGHLPKYPIFVTEQTQLSQFDVRDLASIRINRIPELAEKIRGQRPLDAREVVSLVDACGADTLLGEFSVFSQMREIVMQRVRALKA